MDIPQIPYPANPYVTPLFPSLAAPNIAENPQVYALWISMRKLAPNARSFFEYDPKDMASVAQHRLIYLFLAQIYRRHGQRDTRDAKCATFAYAYCERDRINKQQVFGYFLIYIESELPEGQSEEGMRIKKRRRLSFGGWLAEFMLRKPGSMIELSLHGSNTSDDAKLTDLDLADWDPLFRLRDLSEGYAAACTAYTGDTYLYDHAVVSTENYSSTTYPLCPVNVFSVTNAVNARFKEHNADPFLRGKDERGMPRLVLHNRDEMVYKFSDPYVIAGSGISDKENAWIIRYNYAHPGAFARYLFPHIRPQIDEQDPSFVSFKEFHGTKYPNEAELKHQYLVHFASQMYKPKSMEEFRVHWQKMISRVAADPERIWSVRQMCLEHFPSVWSQAANITGAYRKIIEYGVQYQQRNQNFCSGVTVHDPTTDIFGSIMHTLMSALEYLFQVNSMHRAVIMHMLVVHDASRDDNQEHSIVMNFGPPGASKSFCQRLSASMCIPDTVEFVTRETAMAGTGRQDDPAYCKFSDEIDESNLGISTFDNTLYSLIQKATGQAPPGGGGGALAVFKQTSTNRTVTVHSLDTQNGNRLDTKHTAISFGSRSMNTNAIKSQFPPPVIDRAHTLNFFESTRDHGRDMMSARFDPTNSTQRTMAKTRFIQSTQELHYLCALSNFWESFNMIDPVKMGMSSHVLDLITRTLPLRNGDRLRGARTYAKATAVVRTFTMWRAITIAIRLSIGGPDASRPFQFSDLWLTAPYRVAPLCVVMFAVEFAELYVDEVELRVVTALRDGVFAKFIEKQRLIEEKIAAQKAAGTYSPKAPPPFVAEPKTDEKKNDISDCVKSDCIKFDDPENPEYMVYEDFFVPKDKAFDKSKADKPGPAAQFKFLKNKISARLKDTSTPVTIIVTLAQLSMPRVSDAKARTLKPILLCEGWDLKVHYEFFRNISEDILYHTMQDIFKTYSKEPERFMRGRTENYWKFKLGRVGASKGSGTRYDKAEEASQQYQVQASAIEKEKAALDKSLTDNAPEFYAVAAEAAAGEGADAEMQAFESAKRHFGAESFGPDPAAREANDALNAAMHQLSMSSAGAASAASERDEQIAALVAGVPDGSFDYFPPTATAAAASAGSTATAAAAPASSSSSASDAAAASATGRRRLVMDDGHAISDHDMHALVRQAQANARVDDTLHPMLDAKNNRIYTVREVPNPSFSNRKDLDTLTEQNIITEEEADSYSHEEKIKVGQVTDESLMREHLNCLQENDVKGFLGLRVKKIVYDNHGKVAEEKMIPINIEHFHSMPKNLKVIMQDTYNWHMSANQFKRFLFICKKPDWKNRFLNNEQYKLRGKLSKKSKDSEFYQFRSSEFERSVKDAAIKLMDYFIVRQRYHGMREKITHAWVRRLLHTYELKLETLMLNESSASQKTQESKLDDNWFVMSLYRCADSVLEFTSSSKDTDQGITNSYIKEAMVAVEDMYTGLLRYLDLISLSELYDFHIHHKRLKLTESEKNVQIARFSEFLFEVEQLTRKLEESEALESLDLINSFRQLIGAKEQEYARKNHPIWLADDTSEFIHNEPKSEREKSLNPKTFLIHSHSLQFLIRRTMLRLYKLERFDDKFNATLKEINPHRTPLMQFKASVLNLMKSSRKIKIDMDAEPFVVRNDSKKQVRVMDIIKPWQPDEFNLQLTDSDDDDDKGKGDHDSKGEEDEKREKKHENQTVSPRRPIQPATAAAASPPRAQDASDMSMDHKHSAPGSDVRGMMRPKSKPKPQHAAVESTEEVMLPVQSPPRVEATSQVPPEPASSSSSEVKSEDAATQPAAMTTEVESKSKDIDHQNEIKDSKGDDVKDEESYAAVADSDDDEEGDHDESTSAATVEVDEIDKQLAKETASTAAPHSDKKMNNGDASLNTDDLEAELESLTSKSTHAMGAEIAAPPTRSKDSVDFESVEVTAEQLERERLDRIAEKKRWRKEYSNLMPPLASAASSSSSSSAAAKSSDATDIATVTGPSGLIFSEMREKDLDEDEKELRKKEKKRDKKKADKEFEDDWNDGKSKQKKKRKKSGSQYIDDAAENVDDDDEDDDDEDEDEDEDDEESDGDDDDAQNENTGKQTDPNAPPKKKRKRFVVKEDEDESGPEDGKEKEDEVDPHELYADAHLSDEEEVDPEMEAKYDMYRQMDEAYKAKKRLKREEKRRRKRIPPTETIPLESDASAPAASAAASSSSSAAAAADSAPAAPSEDWQSASMEDSDAQHQAAEDAAIEAAIAATDFQ